MLHLALLHSERLKFTCYSSHLSFVAPLQPHWLQRYTLAHFNPSHSQQLLVKTPPDSIAIGDKLEHRKTRWMDPGVNGMAAFPLLQQRHTRLQLIPCFHISKYQQLPLLLLLVCISVIAHGPAVEAQTLIWADEFTPCNTSVCVNAGINTTNWSFDLGDGSDYGITGQ